MCSLKTQLSQADWNTFRIGEFNYNNSVEEGKSILKKGNIFKDLVPAQIEKAY